MSLDWKAWRKASASANSGDCVEVRPGDDGAMLVRDSKLGDSSPVLSFAAEDWANLLVETATFGLPTRAAVLDADTVVLTDPVRPLALVFTPAEWDAFEAGVIAHEFDLKEVTVGTDG